MTPKWHQNDIKMTRHTNRNNWQETNEWNDPSWWMNLQRFVNNSFWKLRAQESQRISKNLKESRRISKSLDDWNDLNELEWISDPFTEWNSTVWMNSTGHRRNAIEYSFKRIEYQLTQLTVSIIRHIHHRNLINLTWLTVHSFEPSKNSALLVTNDTEMTPKWQTNWINYGRKELGNDSNMSLKWHQNGTKFNQFCQK